MQLSVLVAELQRLERETLSAQESYTAAKVNLAALESQIEADEAAASRYRSALIEADQRAEAAAAAASHLTREQGELAREIDGLDIKYNQLIENLKILKQSSWMAAGGGKPWKAHWGMERKPTKPNSSRKRLCRNVWQIPGVYWIR